MTLEMKETYPSCEPRSARFQESLQMPGQYSTPPEEEAANNIRYGRMRQCVPRRFKPLKRLECVYYSTCLDMSLADPFRSHALVQALPRQRCARFGSPNKAA